MKRVFFVLRGLPGSGKTTLAKKLAEKYNAKIFSTDDLFTINGKYCFRPEHLKEYHELTFNKAIHAMNEGHNVILDNTNIKKSHYLLYVANACRRGYIVCVKTVGRPKDPESWSVYYDRNVHNVPYSSIRRMGEQFEV